MTPRKRPKYEGKRRISANASSPETPDLNLRYWLMIGSQVPRFLCGWPGTRESSRDLMV